MTKTKNIIKTCDCFLDLCIGLNYSLFDYHDFRQKCYDVCEKGKDVFICEVGDSEHLGEKTVTIVVCCLSCVKFLVNLFGVAGMKERIFIECNCEHIYVLIILTVTMSFILIQMVKILIFLIMIKKMKS